MKLANLLLATFLSAIFAAPCTTLVNDAGGNDLQVFGTCGSGVICDDASGTCRVVSSTTVSVSQASAFTRVQLPEFVNATGFISFFANPNLESVDLPKLQRADSFTANSNSKLISVNIPNLATLDRNMDLFWGLPLNNIIVSIPNLRQVGCTCVAAPSLSTFDQSPGPNSRFDICFDLITWCTTCNQSPRPAPGLNAPDKPSGQIGCNGVFPTTITTTGAGTTAPSRGAILISAIGLVVAAILLTISI
jgi:hypothetical protein